MVFLVTRIPKQSFQHHKTPIRMMLINQTATNGAGGWYLSLP